MTLQEQEQVKHVVDAVAATGTGAAFLGYLPDVVAALTAIWVIIRILEAKTVRNLAKKIRAFFNNILD